MWWPEVVLELQAHRRLVIDNRTGLDGGKMSIYEAIGMSWVIFTSALASLGILYLADVGFMTLIRKHESRDGEVPVEVKEMFKIAR